MMNKLTDRTAELRTLEDEFQVLRKRLQCADRDGKCVLVRQIAQIQRDIARNREQLEAIL